MTAKVLRNLRSLRRHVRISKKAFARRLRNNPTPAEAKLWPRLRKCQLGPRFKRQVIIRGWIVDFYCPKRKLVVEVDGSSHDSRKAQDAFRDHVMNSIGLKVLRVTNDEVCTDVNAVVEKIKLWMS